MKTWIFLVANGQLYPAKFRNWGWGDMRRKKRPKIFKALKKPHLVLFLTGKKENYECQDIIFNFNYFSYQGLIWNYMSAFTNKLILEQSFVRHILMWQRWNYKQMSYQWKYFHSNKTNLKLYTDLVTMVIKIVFLLTMYFSHSGTQNEALKWKVKHLQNKKTNKKPHTQQ